MVPENHAQTANRIICTNSCISVHLVNAIGRGRLGRGFVEVHVQIAHNWFQTSGSCILEGQQVVRGPGAHEFRRSDWLLLDKLVAEKPNPPPSGHNNFNGTSRKSQNIITKEAKDIHQRIVRDIKFELTQFSG